MKTLRRVLALAGLMTVAWIGRAQGPATQSAPAEPKGGIYPGERHFRSLRQLTFGGENAEAYWSFESDRLIFQSTRDGYPCDRIYTVDLESVDAEPRLVSTGSGKTTCGYFYPGGEKILYASTHLAAPDCPPRPDFSQGYVWALDPGFDIFKANADGSDLVRLTDTAGYDAEATIAPNGGAIVFTSVRDGDLELYVMGPDGEHPKRLTDAPGYDGGAFFSPDSRRIVWRAARPAAGAERDDYFDLLKQHQIRPGKLELFVMNADGSGQRQVTDLGGANFAPYFHPDGRRIIFVSNHREPQGRNFDLFLVRDDGGELEQLTTYQGFDGFPMFDASGKRLVFASNRLGKQRGETNIFLAELE
ncbi:MAG TPA: hypothetical protein VGB99_04425 [Acidobacteriota bacterium]